jgi:DNA adenine methylase
MEDKIIVPPIKIQGKKTKLVSWIKQNIIQEESDLYIEPFLGSGVVGFNIAPPKALFSDSNPHIINFYNAVKEGSINPAITKDFLEKQGKLLSEQGQTYFNYVRSRFNEEHQPLDFLFLNRSCFNGMIRFNRHFKFNVPYGHKPERFAQAYITKICNQIKHVDLLIRLNNWNFVCQDFKTTLQHAKQGDFVYCDPPYIGRHVDYFDSWTEEDEIDLNKLLNQSGSHFMVSTWHSNKYRTNAYINTLWQKCNSVTKTHFYHVGAKEENRNEVLEALILNYEPNEVIEEIAKLEYTQLAMF